MLTVIVNTCGVDALDLAATFLFPVKSYLRLEYIDGLMQETHNFIAYALGLRLCCTHPSLYQWLHPRYYRAILLFIHALTSVVLHIVCLLFPPTTENNDKTNHSIHLSYVYARIGLYFHKWLDLGPCCLYFGPLRSQNWPIRGCGLWGGVLSIIWKTHTQCIWNFLWYILIR